MNFEKWIETYECWETFVGVNRMTHRNTAKLAWDFKEEENKKDKKEIVRLRAMLSNCRLITDNESMIRTIDKVLADKK